MLGSFITHLVADGWLILEETDFSLALVQKLVLNASYLLDLVELCKLKKKNPIIK